MTDDEIDKMFKDIIILLLVKRYGLVKKTAEQIIEKDEEKYIWKDPKRTFGNIAEFYYLSYLYSCKY